MRTQIPVRVNLCVGESCVAFLAFPAVMTTHGSCMLKTLDNGIVPIPMKLEALKKLSSVFSVPYSAFLQ